jgi:large subunit ribosomal protein L15
MAGKSRTVKGTTGSAGTAAAEGTDAPRVKASRSGAWQRIGLDNLVAAPGSHRDRKRLGRGPGSGTGKTSGKGTKGIKARAGHHGPGGGKPQFEGGQMPLTRRVPKRGFTNPFREEAQVVRLNDLDRLPHDAEVTTSALVEAGLIRAGHGPAKVLANGTVSRAVTVRGIKVSAGARAKILAAGGTVD